MDKENGKPLAENERFSLRTFLRGVHVVFLVLLRLEETRVGGSVTVACVMERRGALTFDGFSSIFCPST